MLLCVALPLKYLAPFIQIHRDNHTNPIIFRDKYVYNKFQTYDALLKIVKKPMYVIYIFLLDGIFLGIF